MIGQYYKGSHWAWLTSPVHEWYATGRDEQNFKKLSTKIIHITYTIIMSIHTIRRHYVRIVLGQPKWWPIFSTLCVVHYFRVSSQSYTLLSLLCSRRTPYYNLYLCPVGQVRTPYFITLYCHRNYLSTTIFPLCGCTSLVLFLEI